jgi:hypothetical protein
MIDPKPGYTVLAKGDKVVFDFHKQAWVQDSGQELDGKQFTGRAEVQKDVRFETRIGLRSSDAELKVTETI